MNRKQNRAESAWNKKMKSVKPLDEWDDEDWLTAKIETIDHKLNSGNLSIKDWKSYQALSKELTKELKAIRSRKEYSNE